MNVSIALDDATRKDLRAPRRSSTRRPRRSRVSATTSCDDNLREYEDAAPSLVSLRAYLVSGIENETVVFILAAFSREDVLKSRPSSSSSPRVCPPLSNLDFAMICARVVEFNLARTA